MIEAMLICCGGTVAERQWDRKLGLLYVLQFFPKGCQQNRTLSPRNGVSRYRMNSLGVNIGNGGVLAILDGQDMLKVEFDDTSDGMGESESEQEDNFDENNSMEYDELENELDELINDVDG